MADWDWNIGPDGNIVFSGEFEPPGVDPAIRPPPRPEAPPMTDYRDMARQAAARYGIPPDLFMALVTQESGWNPSITSPAGAYGLAQLMPGTAKSLGVDPNDPAQNLDGGARYLSQQYKKFGDWRLALAAYNAGPGAVSKHGGIPPYRETQNYVRKVMGNWEGGEVPGLPGHHYGSTEVPQHNTVDIPGRGTFHMAGPPNGPGLLDMLAGDTTPSQEKDLFKNLGIFGAGLTENAKPGAPPPPRRPGRPFEYQRPENTYGASLLALLGGRA